MTTEQIINHALQLLAALAPILWQIWVRRQDRKPSNPQTSTLPRSLPWAVRYGLWIVIIPALASLGWTISESTPMTRGTVVSIAFDFAMIVIAFVLNEQSRRIIQNTETVNLLQKMSETVGALGQQHLILLRIVENIVAKQVVDTKQKKRK